MIPWRFEDAYDQDHPFRSMYVHFLYNALKERLTLENVNISHTKLPTYAQHIAFLESEPYKYWDIVVSAVEPNICIGSVYVTKQNEIGIYIHKNFRRKGYGTAIIKTMIEAYPEEEFYANINPRNSTSIKTFESLGFEHVQNTYRLKARE